MILLISLLLLFALSVPIAVALGLVSLLGLIMIGDVPLTLVSQRMVTAVNSFPLLAVPFFILAGHLMERGGLSRRLIEFVSALVGTLSGGLALAAVLTCMFFAAISGSSAATAAAVGAVLIPAMQEKGYAKEFSSAVVASSGEMGVIIPPSIPMILYGVLASVSIGDMFLAGIYPGILVAGSVMLVAYYISRRRGYKGNAEVSFAHLLRSFGGALLALLMPFIILGGIYGGVFTPTEAAVVAVVYGLVVGGLVYREFNLKDIPEILVQSARTTSVIMVIIASASLLGWILTREQMPQAIAGAVLGLSESPLVYLLLVNILLLIVGMFFESSAALVILTPILLPIATSLGIDPVHFGVIMIVNLAVGMVTPPLGVNLFITCNIAGIGIETITRSLLPFFVVLILDILIITYVPAISLSLP